MWSKVPAEMNLKLVRVGAEKSFWESEWGTWLSGLVEGLCVTRVISMVTDQHGSSDSFMPRASGSHEKGDSHSKWRGRNQERSMNTPLLCRILAMKCYSIQPPHVQFNYFVPLSKPTVFRERTVFSWILAHLRQGLNSFTVESEGNLGSGSSDTAGGKLPDRFLFSRVWNCLQ